MPPYSDSNLVRAPLDARAGITEHMTGMEREYVTGGFRVPLEYPVKIVNFSERVRAVYQDRKPDQVPLRRGRAFLSSQSACILSVNHHYRRHDVEGMQ